MQRIERQPDERISRLRSLPFLGVHVVAIAALFTEWDARHVLAALALYVVRMFFVTAGLHRYFSHRGYKLGRAAQLLMAIGGTTAAQKGPLWWAGQHRLHHRHSDQAADPHSPKKGLLFSHLGWFLCEAHDEVPARLVRDLARYPELRWLDRFHLVPPALLALALWLVGGLPLLTWGFFASTVLLWHASFAVNSLAHLYGSRRFLTPDTSRNSWPLALLTLGEGFHNNHHHFPASARQGFFWWELDLAWLALRALALVGIAHDLRTPPAHVLTRALVKDAPQDPGLLGLPPPPRRAVTVRETLETTLQPLADAMQAREAHPSSK